MAESPPSIRAIEAENNRHPLSDPQACRDWLARVPAADPLAGVRTICAALDRIPGRGSFVALTVLETLRTQAARLLDALADRYADKALPLSDPQRMALDASDGLARQLANLCAESIAPCIAAPPEYRRYAALLHQRAIFWIVQSVIQQSRARQRVPDTLWQSAREAMRSAQRLGLADAPVRDSLQPGGQSSVSAIYARALLIGLCGARSLTAREFEYACQIACDFERKIVVIPAEAADQVKRSKSVRLGGIAQTLDVDALATSLGGRLAALNRGQEIESPILSPPATPQALKGLIGKLYGAWCGRANQRKFPRRARQQTVFCAFDPENIYALMKRRPYIAPPAPKLYSHQEVANIFLTQKDVPFQGQGHTPETWQHVLATLDQWRLIEESATGMSMRRQIGFARVRRGQLAAIRLGKDGTAMVGEVRWTEQIGVDDSSVELGLEMLPGLARAGAARHADRSSITRVAGNLHSTAALILDNFSRGNRAGPGAHPGQTSRNSAIGGIFEAISLPDIDADLVDQKEAAPSRRYSERATVVLPAGWAQQGNEIDFIDGPAARRLRLGTVAARHGEFERMYFTVIA